MYVLYIYIYVYVHIYYIYNVCVYIYIYICNEYVNSYMLPVYVVLDDFIVYLRFTFVIG